MKRDVSPEEILLNKYLSLPEVAREYIYRCIKDSRQRVSLINDLFDAYLEQSNLN